MSITETPLDETLFGGRGTHVCSFCGGYKKHKESIVCGKCTKQKMETARRIQEISKSRSFPPDDELEETITELRAEITRLRCFLMELHQRKEAAEGAMESTLKYIRKRNEKEIEDRRETVNYLNYEVHRLKALHERYSKDRNNWDYYVSETNRLRDEIFTLNNLYARVRRDWEFWAKPMKEQILRCRIHAIQVIDGEDYSI